MISSPSSWNSSPDNVSLPDDEVHVWRVVLDLEAADTESLRELLSPDERERADRFRFPIHRQRFITARGALRMVLGRYLASKPEGVRFKYGPHGKPGLTGDELSFNVAHSEGLALVAVARNRELGVDLESLSRNTADEEIAKRFFSANEVAALRALPQELRRTGFFNCWTRKEAFIKARGKGLSMPLDQFEVSLTPGEPAKLLATPTEPVEALRWTLCELLPGDGFAAALVVEGGGWKLRCWQWQLPK